MKKVYQIFLLIPFILLLNIRKSQATHAVGMDISYFYVSGNDYIVTVKFYRNCGDAINPIPTQAPATVTIYYSSTSCSLNGSVIANQLPGTGNEIQTTQFPPCGATYCNGGTGYGVQEYVYRELVTLPGACADWVIGAYVNARNAAITTLSTPGNLSLYVECSLDNLNYPINNSPLFSSYPVSQFCINHTFNYPQSATDPDGDSLVFSLVDALTTPAFGPPAPAVVPYIFPYTGLNPISSVPAVSINSQSGLLFLSPDLQQVGVLAILVEEYRNGVLIGSVRRDMQINVALTCNFPPLLQPSTFNNTPGLSGSAHCNDTVIYLHLTTPVLCNSIDSDGTDFRMYSPTGLPIPVIREEAINCIAGLTDSIKLYLYRPYLYQNGTYIIYSKVGNDGNTLLNGCSNSMAENDTAYFSFHDCYEGKVDLTNVSVDLQNKDMEITWLPPADTVWPRRFLSFEIYRSYFTTVQHDTMIGTVLDSSATTFTDNNADIPLQPYRYAVLIHLMQGYSGLLSDSIESIYLNGKFNSDSLTIDLAWTPYYGWPNPEYRIVESDDSGATFFVVPGATTTDTSFGFARPLNKGSYIVRIETLYGNLVARSNWYTFDIIKRDVIAPNVITPNDDGKNETFSFENLNNYPNSKLNIFNRWGRKIYESSNYLNDWKGENFPDGVYYYTLKIADKKSTEMTGIVHIIRNK